MSSSQDEMNIQDTEEIILDVPENVIGVFQNLVLAKQIRSQEGTIKQLCTIHDRVKAALTHFGANTNIHATKSEIIEEEMRRRRPPGFRTKARREEMLHKQNILDTIHEFIQVSIRRETLVDEVGDWLFDVQMTLDRNLLSDEFFKERDKEEIEMERATNAVLNDSRKFVRKNVDKLKNLGKDLFQEMNELAQQEHLEPSGTGSELKPAFSSLATQRQVAIRAKTKETQEVLNERALLADVANWKSAAQEVKKALEDTLV